MTALAATASGTAARAASPTNGLILFTSTASGGGTTQLYSIEPNGTGLTQLTFGPGSSDDGQWSPNGQQIVFMSNRSGPTNKGPWRIYTMNADGSNVTQLTTRSSRTPAWSPDGSHIVFMETSIPPNGNFDIYTMNANGTNQVRLTTDSSRGLLCQLVGEQRDRVREQDPRHLPDLHHEH